MPKIKTSILPVESWPLVEPIMRGEFGNGMPATPAQAIFLAAMEGERLAGFIHVEHLIHFSCVYVAPEHRTSNLGLRLMKEADSLVPVGSSAIVLADTDHLTKMLLALGGRELKASKIFRKDY